MQPSAPKQRSVVRIRTPAVTAACLRVAAILAAACTVVAEGSMWTSSPAGAITDMTAHTATPMGAVQAQIEPVTPATTHCLAPDMAGIVASIPTADMTMLTTAKGRKGRTSIRASIHAVAAAGTRRHHRTMRGPRMCTAVAAAPALTRTVGRMEGSVLPEAMGAVEATSTPASISRANEPLARPSLHTALITRAMWAAALQRLAGILSRHRLCIHHPKRSLAGQGSPSAVPGGSSRLSRAQVRVTAPLRRHFEGR